VVGGGGKALTAVLSTSRPWKSSFFGSGMNRPANSTATLSLLSFTVTVTASELTYVTVEGLKKEEEEGAGAGDDVAPPAPGAPGVVEGRRPAGVIRSRAEVTLRARPFTGIGATPPLVDPDGLLSPLSLNTDCRTVTWVGG
jgi:hypothetical protein